MRVLLLFTCIALTLTTQAQKIKKSEVDKFTKEKRIETSDVILKMGLVETLGAHIRSVSDSYFILFRGTGSGAGVIGTDDKLIILLDNDSTITVLSTGIQDYDIGSNYKAYIHQYRIALEDIETLSTHNAKSIRKYMSRGYVDMDIPDKKQDELKKLAQVFLKELNK